MDNISWVLNSTGEVYSIFWNSCPFCSRQLWEVFVVRLFQAEYSGNSQDVRGQWIMRILLTSTAVRPVPSHACWADWSSCTLVSSQIFRKRSWLCVWWTLLPLLLGAISTHIEPREEDRWRSLGEWKKSVIPLTWTKLTCADRWKWSKARMNIPAARRGNEGDRMSRYMEQDPRLSHCSALQ